MSSVFSRRRVLAAIAAVGACVPAIRPTRGLVAGPDPAIERLVGLFKHRDSARAIGSAYLAMRPEEADPHNLVELITRADQDPLVVHHTSTTELRDWLRRRQARDFATGRIVTVDGWLLAATEVRLCALAALT